MVKTVDALQASADALRNAGRVVVATGGGMSSERGNPKVRGAFTGLWVQFEPRGRPTEEAMLWRSGLGCFSTSPVYCSVVENLARQDSPIGFRRPGLGGREDAA